MSPNAECCSEDQSLGTEDVLIDPITVHHGRRRVIPEEPLPAQAWLENEEGHSNTNSPDENRRLLSLESEDPKTKTTHPSVNLLVPKKGPYEPRVPQRVKPKVKTKVLKKGEKLKQLAKPPYFILVMIIVMTLFNVFDSPNLRFYLEWSPNDFPQEPWRLVTYGFLHASAGHTALNAFVAFCVGWVLECEQCWWRIALVWWAGVISGAMGAGMFQPDVHVVGASAAVYALLTSHISNVYLRRGHISLWWFRPLSVLVLCLTESAWAVMHAYHATEFFGTEFSRENVAWSAHALGAVVGMPLSLLIYTGENVKCKRVVIYRVASLAVLVALTAGTIVYYILMPKQSSTR